MRPASELFGELGRHVCQKSNKNTRISVGPFPLLFTFHSRPEMETEAPGLFSTRAGVTGGSAPLAIIKFQALFDRKGIAPD